MSVYARNANWPVPQQTVWRPIRPAPLAAETESGFARLFLPTLFALLVATGCLGWQSWDAQDAPSPDPIALGLQ